MTEKKIAARNVLGCVLLVSAFIVLAFGSVESWGDLVTVTATLSDYRPPSFTASPNRYGLELKEEPGTVTVQFANGERREAVAAFLGSCLPPGGSGAFAGEVSIRVGVITKRLAYVGTAGCIASEWKHAEGRDKLMGSGK